VLHSSLVQLHQAVLLLVLLLPNYCKPQRAKQQLKQVLISP
jgi:hypothetical protein